MATRSPAAPPAAGVIQILECVQRALHEVELARLADVPPTTSPVESWGETGLPPLRSVPALERILVQLHLDEEDLWILGLAVVPYLQPTMATRFQVLQGSAIADRCSVALALEVLYGDAVARLDGQRRFADEQPLFQSGLVTLEVSPHVRGDALIERVLCVPQRTVDLLMGRIRLDSDVRRFCAIEETKVTLDRVIAPAERKVELLALVKHHDRFRETSRRLGFDKAIPYGRGVTLLFAGPSGTGKTLCARALAHDLGRPLVRVYSDKLSAAGEALEPTIHSLLRDASLFGAVVFFDECESLFGKRAPGLGILLTELERHEGIVVLATCAPQSLDGAMDRRIVFRMDFELPEPLDREQIWELHLPPEAPVAADVDIGLLANLYDLTGASIKNAVVVALNKAIDASPESPLLTMPLLRASAEAQLKCNLEDYAQRIRSPLGFSDLILPEAERDKLLEIRDACENRELVLNKWGFGRRLTTGRGFGVLFDGPPGTGKTLCAEILARELDRPLYRVHVPNVVSKWVGETEKNIAEIFSRARVTQAILLFDEADSLFGKRTEVKSANDRFANQEVNLLLQEIERYDGVVILTTNLFGSLDDALKRRIQYRITFPFPGPAERARIWESLIPAAAPVATDIDYVRLGRQFELAGGNIKNAIVRAAYRACSKSVPISMAQLLEAGRLECESMGLAVREGVVDRPLRGAPNAVKDRG